MKVFYTPRAQKAIELIAAYVENKNTSGSGNKFALKFESAINKFASENVVFTKCRNEILSYLAYSCLTINKWVVAFKIKQNKFIVYRIIWGGLLK